jgi:hypothetical protein
VRRRNDTTNCLEWRPGWKTVVQVLITLDGQKNRLGMVCMHHDGCLPQEMKIQMLDDKSIQIVPWCVCTRLRNKLSVERKKKESE